MITLSLNFFLVQGLLSAISFVFLARFMVQAVNANFYNPVSQLLIRLTRPLLKPLSAIIPSKGAINWGCIIALIGLQLLTIVAFVSIEQQATPTLAETISWTGVGLLSLLFNFFYIAVIVWALLSWLARDGRNPMYNLLTEILAPVMRPFEKLIPSMGGLSFSAIAFLFLLSFTQGAVMPVLKHMTRFYYGLM